MQLHLNKFKAPGIILVIVFILLFLRRPDSFTNPQIYAEDGPVFLSQYFELGIKSLITPYAGYLHLIPRLIVYLFGSLNINLLYIPLWYNLSAFLITYLVALQLWESSFYLKLNNRVLYGTIFLFVPVGSEMFMNVTNTIWLTALFLINYLLIGYKHGNKYVNWILVLLFSLSGPFSLLISPIVVLIILIERKSINMNKFVPLLFILMGGLVQFIFIKTGGSVSRGTGGKSEKYHLFELIKNNICNLIFVKPGFINQILLTLLILFLFAIIVWVIYRSYLKINIERKYVLLLAPALFLGSFITVFWPFESEITSLVCPRYYFVPYSCLACLIILAVDTNLKLWHNAVYLLYFLLQYTHLVFRLPDKNWKGQIQEYYSGKKDSVEINPASNWLVRLPHYENQVAPKIK